MEDLAPTIRANALLLLSALVYTLALLNCISIVRQNLSPSTALAWILVNIAFPWLGVPLYYLIGQNRLRHYSHRRERSEAELSEVTRRRPEPPPAKAGVESAQPHLLQQVFSRLNPSFRSRPCSVELLVDGTATFGAIFAEIVAARHYIFVQYYILRADRLGLRLQELLIRKAKEGVQVYLIYDDIGSFWLNRSYVRALKQAGVQVARFLPFSFPRGLQVNFRNHRKLVLVDGTVAFTGGLNVGDEYVGRGRLKNWRDTHIRISGPAVSALRELFLTDWFFAAKKPIKLAPLAVAVEPAITPASTTHASRAQIIPFGPGDKDFVGILVFMQLVQSATKRLWISSPYFVPDAALERLLELAVMRGVDVRLLLPRVSDHPIVYWVSLSYAHQMQARGVKVYLYNEGFLHQKLMVIDDEVTVVGTSNFDNRTFYLNFETTVVIHSASLNETAAGILNTDFGKSIALAPDMAEALETSQFKVQLARLLAPLM